MNKVKLLSIIAIGLLIANLVLVGFIVSNKPPHPRHNKPKEIIIKRLHFDNDQTKKYELLIVAHQNDIRETESEIRELKNELYSTLYKVDKENLIDSLINAIADKERVMEVINYKHFEDIKKICKPDQLEDFKQFSQEIANLFDHKVPPHLRDE
jgi:periplasmic protein CpxP/Spy